ncbi:MAG TPA: hypothetical protein VER04_19005 [Polyangiaceae bacterium]|nr:hypothetical protein [Polyangiaceae bacterium]
MSGKPKWQPRLLSSQAKLSAHAGEGVTFEDAAQLALLQRGAHSDAPLFEGCNRFDPGANNVFDAGKTSGGNLRLGRARDVFWKVGGLDVSCH